MKVTNDFIAKAENFVTNVIADWFNPTTYPESIDGKTYIKDFADGENWEMETEIINKASEHFGEENITIDHIDIILYYSQKFAKYGSLEKCRLFV